MILIEGEMPEKSGEILAYLKKPKIIGNFIACSNFDFTSLKMADIIKIAEKDINFTHIYYFLIDPEKLNTLYCSDDYYVVELSNNSFFWNDVITD